MNFLKVLVIISFVFLTLITLKLHPDMHQPMIIEDADFKLTRISDTLSTENIPVNSTIQKQVNPKKTEKRITTSSPEPEDSQLELLERILEQTEQEAKQQPEKVEQKPVQKQNTNFKNPYMTEQEEIIAWNKWRSNLQNQIMRDSQIDYAPLGTLFLFTFVVDKFGNISNIKVECSNPNYMDVARNNVKPAIANLQKKPILNFPNETQRTSTVVTGLFLIGTQERYSTPNDFSDYERVTY